jgi:ABC-2 type transport system permease protein
MTLKYLLEKEFKQTWRNKIVMGMIIIFPLVVILVMPWAATLDVKNIQVSVVDNDYSSLSREFTEHIQNSTYFSLASATRNYSEGINEVELGNADMVLEIPAGFETDLINTGTTPIQVSINTVNSIKGVMGQSYINMLASEFSKEKALLINADQSGIRPKVDIIVKNMYNPTLDYKHTMVPGLIMITLIILCGFLPALNIVIEKERGTIEQLNVTPIGKVTFILAKLIPFWIIGFITVTFGFLFAWLIYGLVPPGGYTILYLFIGLFIFTMTGFGLLISNNSSTMQQSTFVMFFFVIIFVMLCGLLTPVDSMPDWAKFIAGLTPTKYMVNVLRCVYLKGSGLSDLIPDFIALSIMMVFYNVWAVLSYRKSK